MLQGSLQCKLCKAAGNSLTVRWCGWNTHQQAFFWEALVRHKSLRLLHVQAVAASGAHTANRAGC